MKRFFLSVTCLFILSFAVAQVPGTLSYQGILVKSDGTPVTDGNHSVTFNFYKVVTGGIPVFTRGPITVSTYKGMFTLLLGTGTPTTVNDPLPVTASDVNYIGGVQYYIELVADAVILSPRVQLSSVPYAFTAQNANAMSAAGLTGTTAIANGGTGAATAAAARTNLGLGSIATLGAVTTTEIVDLTILNADINASAGIVDTKLATISTAGKVSGSAITSGTIAGSTAFNTSGAVVSTVSSGNAISGTSSSTSGGAGLYGVNNSSSTAAVGIYGYTPNLSGNAAKAVWGYSPAGIGVEGQSDSGYGLYGVSTSGTGVYGETSGNSYAGYFYNGTTSGGMGLYSSVTNTGATSGTKYGLYSLAWYGLGSNYGVYAYGYGGTNAYGIYAIAGGGSSTNYAGYFSGNVYSSGTYTGSDKKLKKDIQPLSGGLDVVMRLKPSKYYFRNEGEFKRMNLPAEQHYGLIAQDVEEVLPSIVSEVVQPAETDAKTKNELNPEIHFKGLNYTELIPILIKAIQEQQAQIEDLKKDIAILKQK